MQIEIQIPKAVLFDVKYTVEQATNKSIFAGALKGDMRLNFMLLYDKAALTFLVGK